MNASKSEQEPVVASKSPQWRDVPYIFVVLVFIIGFVVISAIDLSDYRKTKCFAVYFGDPRVGYFSPNILGILAISILVTFILSGVYYSIAAVYPDNFIIWSMILQIIVSLGCAIFYFTQTQFLSGTLSIFWLAASCLMYWLVWAHIGSATIQLDISMRIAERNPSMIIISVLGALFCAGWSTLVASVILAGLGKSITSDCSVKHVLRPESEFLALLAYLILCNYLLSEVVKQVVRMCICYTYGWWCFMPKELGTVHHSETVDDYPCLPVVTWMGLLASLSYSLGSLCLCSMCLAFGKLAAQLVSAWSQALIVKGTRPESQDASAILLAWVLYNVLRFVEAVLSHFSNYIVIYISLDNVGYLEAFRRTITLLYNEGINAFINDCLACGTLMFSSWCIGAISTLVIFVYLRIFQIGPIDDGAFLICSFVMVINVQVSSILTTGISSGVQTLFVVMSADPERLRAAHPQLSGLMARYMA